MQLHHITVFMFLSGCHGDHRPLALYSLTFHKLYKVAINCFDLPWIDLDEESDSSDETVLFLGWEKQFDSSHPLASIPP